MARSASATDMAAFKGADDPLLPGVVERDFELGLKLGLKLGLEPGLEHGGDLGLARRLFPGAPEPFIDLSTGINPFCYGLGGLRLGFALVGPRRAAELRARLGPRGLDVRHNVYYCQTNQERIIVPQRKPVSSRKR